eukprot:2054456-Amphidinium_carterae.2
MTSWYSLTSPRGRMPGQSCTSAKAGTASSLQTSGTTSLPWTRDSLPLLVIPKLLQALETMDSPVPTPSPEISGAEPHPNPTSRLVNSQFLTHQRSLSCEP